MDTRLRAAMVFVLVVLAAVLLSATVLVSLYQERIIWQPPRPPWGAEAATAGARRVAYAAADGQPLAGYLVEPPPVEPPPVEPSSERGESAGTVPRRVLVAFHGNAEIAAWRVPWAREVARRTGWTVFLPEYRGYAGLSGRPGYEGSRADARAALAWVRDSLGVPNSAVALHGFSLGSGVAAELAAEVAPRRLLLESPFTSAAEMARVAGAWPAAMAWRVVGRVKFDTRRSLEGVTAPLWIAHGDADQVVPTRMGRALHAAARTPGELLIVPGAGHNDLVERGGAEYWGWVERALEGEGARARRREGAR